MNSNIGVQLHSNGLFWQARWWDSVGVRQTKSLGAKAKVSKRQARELCKELAIKHAVTPAARDVGKAPTLGEWREQYTSLRDGELKDGTMGLHEVTLDYLIARFGEGCRLDGITDAMADDFRAWLGRQPVKRSKAKPATLGKHTVAAHIRNCKVIFKRAKKRKYISANPFDEVSGSAPDVTKDWADITRDDLERILAKCPNGSWRRLFALARLAGLRRGEALRLAWGDFDQDSKTLSVRPEDGIEGTKQRARTVPVEPRLYALLREGYDDADEGEVLVCAGISEENMHRDAGKIIKAAGLPRYAKPFHTLRKLLETEWMGLHPVMVVCEWLGHGPEVARKHYNRARATDVARVTGGPLAGTNQAQNVDSRA